MKKIQHILSGFLIILGIFVFMGCGSSAPKITEYHPSSLELFPKSSVYQTDGLYWIKTNLPPVDNQYIKYEWYVNDTLVSMYGGQYDNAGENSFVIGQWAYSPGNYRLKCKTSDLEANAVFYVTPCITGRKVIYVYDGNQLVDIWYAFCSLQYCGNETNDTFPAGTVWLDFLSVATGYMYTDMNIKVDLNNVYRISGSYISLTFTDQFGYNFNGTYTSNGYTWLLTSSERTRDFPKDINFAQPKFSIEEYFKDIKKIKGNIHD